MRGLIEVILVDAALGFAIAVLVITIWGASFLVSPVTTWSLP